jgi:hypothetical protein
MREHFKTHGMIHLMWIIAVLVLCIVAMITWNPQSKLIQDYISFAATFASLFLAIVAIIYSIVSSDSLSGILSGNLDAVQRITGLAERLDSISQEISNETKALSYEVSKVPDSVKNLQDHLSSRLDTFSQSFLPKEKDDAESDINSEDTNIGFDLSMYTLSIMHESGKSVDTDHIRDNIDSSFGWIIFGIFTTISIMKPCDIELERIGSNFKLKSFGRIDASAFRSKDFSTSTGSIKSIREKIDAHIGIVENCA